MYLKNLTMLGFKSFADKTSLNFLPGITAIVGPNGCGKSNVADAIRWVLGEQSAKALRGGEMADVIFTGTDSRRSLGMAEVSLTIGDVDAEHLRAAGVELAYNEVTLTRRVFRDGGSEYFINRTPCRLKDIQQLFMGTGVGRTSYSIMAQGNITQILSSKPEDRRMVFEEAAGITRFKAQKRESLRKLELTEQNLVRVADLIREVKRQIGSLQRQAGKARRYKQLRLELQHLDTQLARHQFDLWQSEIVERQAASEELRARAEEISGNVSRIEHELASVREQWSETERQINLAQQADLGLRNQIDRHEHRIQFNRERCQELETQHQQALQELAQAETRLATVEQELKDLTERLAVSAVKMSEHQQTLISRQQVLDAIDSELLRGQSRVKEWQAKSLNVAQQLTRARNEITALDLQKQNNAVRFEKLSSEKIQLEQERVILAERLRDFAAQVEAEKVDVQSQRGTIGERQERLRAVEREWEAASAALDRLLQRQTDKQSSLRLLQQLVNEYEGFSGGALAALRQAGHGLGSLADKLRVPQHLVTAIENILGHHLQLVLTQEPEDALRILEDLQHHGRGRASLAPLNLSRGPAPTPSSPALSSEQADVRAAGVGVGDAAEVPAVEPIAALAAIETDASVQALVNVLLDRVFIVSDLNEALRWWRHMPGQHDYVTLKGEILSRHGVLTGGTQDAGSADRSHSILGRKNQIAELERDLAQLHEEVGETSRQKGLIAAERTGLQASLQQAQTDLRTQEVAIATRQGEFNALENSQRLLGQKIETVIYEIQTLADGAREADERRSVCQGTASELADAEAAAQSELTAGQQHLDRSRAERESAQALLMEAKVAAATEEQVHASFRAQQNPLKGRATELAQLMEQRRAEIGSCLQRRAQTETENAESSRQIVELQKQRTVLETELASGQAQREIYEAEIATHEGTLRSARSNLAEAQERRGGLEVELAQKRMATQNLRDQIQQKYQVDLDQVRSECITITFADEGPAKVQTLTPQEMAESGAATDWRVVAEQVAALQKRIDEMGPVNLVAIDEYEETEQRYQFLSKQHDDLVNAKAQLLEVINRINRETQEMFTATFTQIRDNFRLMFTEIFGGGKADLMLVNEGDVLESGIEIVARPPGKQLQTISLLSGGEQTMTAVALLFSIYQVKPSPFCVLDELDAPLDESNINRFIRILQRFLVNSQFIIITHNKRTIGMADVLYGVTMEEQGVSKIVSVKFHKTGEHLDHPVSPLGPGLGPKPVEEEEDKVQSKEETLEVVMAK